MKFGHIAFVTFYSTNTVATGQFLGTLGFSTIASDDESTLLTDGNLYFDLRRAEKNKTMLSYCVHDVTNAVEMAQNLEIDIVEKSPHHVIVREPNGLLILLAGPDVVSLRDFEKKPSSLCGTFYEASLETNDVDRSIVWWQNVGFKVTAHKDTWCTLDDGKIMIGLYKKGNCPHLFRNPSLTYFEPDMGERIAELKKEGIQFLQEEKEIGMKGHAIAESPDGQYFFLFSV
jgi:hypothetical protein